MVEGEEIIKPALHIVTKYLDDKASTFATGIPLSDSTMARRVEMMSEDVSEQLIQSQEDAVFFLIALDESTDATDTAQLAIFGRIVDQELKVKEELLDPVAMEGRTRGVDILNALKKCAEKMNFQWDKLTSVCTDGAPAMTGCNVGFFAQLKQFLGRTLLKYHCIIHQESLCGKSLQMKDIMSVVVKCVNDIRAAALKRREFRQLLNEVDEVYGKLLLHTEVRWLSRGKVLARFLTVKDHVHNFLCEKKMLPEKRQKLKDPSWLNDLAFLTDISGQLSTLNKRMQGKQQLVSHLNDQVNSFRQKLQLFRHQLSERCFDNFSALKDRVAEPGNRVDEDFYVDKLDVMIENFEQRFEELDSDKAKHQKSTIYQSVCSRSWQNAFRSSGIDRSSKFRGAQSMLREVIGDGHREGLGGLLEGRTSHSLFRVTIIQCEIHLSLWNDVSVRTSFLYNEIRKVEVQN